MTTNTPNPASSSANAPELPSVGFEETDQLRTVTTSVEEEFLLRTFGIAVPREANINPADHDALAQAMARQVGQRVFTVIDQTRSAVDVPGLHAILNQRLQTAFHRIEINNPGALLNINDTMHARRVRAVCEAIRESLPAAILNDVVRYGLPAFVPEKPNRNDHIIEIENVYIRSPRVDGSQVGNCKIEIDSRNEFWRRDHVQVGPPPTNLATALTAALITGRQTLSTIGIRVVSAQPVAEDFRISNPADIAAIAQTGSARGIDLEKRYDVIQMQSGGFNITIDSAKLIRYRDASNRRRLVASYRDPNELRDLLIHDVTAQQYITLIPNTPAAFTAPLCAAIAGRVFADLRDPPVGPLAIRENSLTTIQAEIAEQHRFFENMREGSDNHWAAAMATSMVMTHKDLRDTLRGRAPADIQREITIAQHELAVIQAVEQIDANTIPGGGGNWQIMRDKEADIQAELSTASTHAGPFIPYTTHIGVAPFNESYVLQQNSATGDADVAGLNGWLRSKLSETQSHNQEYRNLESRLRAALTAINALGVARGAPILPGTIATLVPVGAPTVYANFTSPIDLLGMATEIRTNSGLTGRNRDETTATLTRLNTELREGATRRITGAEAQHRVISAELMRYHGLTEDEARRGTNVLRARALLDTDTAQVAERIAGDLYGEHEHHHAHGLARVGQVITELPQNIPNVAENMMRFNVSGSRHQAVIRSIAESCHVPLSSREGTGPLWAQTQRYDDLITAYHSLRKLKNQTFYNRTSDVPWDLRLKDGQQVDAHMREITRALLLKHAKGLLQDFGSSLGLTAGDQQRILADPTKPEHVRILEQIIAADPNAAIASRVHHVIEHADHRVQPVKRFISKSLFGKDYGMITGAKNPISYRALIYGNPTFSLLGAWNGVKNLGRNINSRKGALMLGGALGFLALGPAAPLGIAAASTAGGLYWGKPPPAATASSGGGAAPAHH